MNRYEQRQEARRARYEARAEKAAAEARSLANRAQDMASVIPLGQPILVGHHSEKRDRNYRGRINATYCKAAETERKAGHYAAKAAAVGTGGISSDDPDAVPKLRAQLAECEALQARMKAANSAIRKNDREALAALGFSATVQEKLFRPDFAGRIGFADYMLTNNSANMRRIRQRIADLQARAQREDVRKECDRYTYEESAEENRAMFIFPAKPDAFERTLLKSHGFKWSPTRGAWVRQLNNAARFAASQVRRALDAD
jgi:hypothetical protein